MLQCRQQDCLTGDTIGPARAAVSCVLGNQTITEGEIIDPPSNTASVSVDNLKVSKVVIIDKEPNPFKNGFWDVTLKYVFLYKLTFREADGQIIGSIMANSIFTKKVTLFGSIGTDITLSTDLFSSENDSCNLDSDPFILVESKAVALTSELRYINCCCNSNDTAASEPNEVFVTIGLFTIIKLFRIVNLTVQSRGFCIPEECGYIFFLFLYFSIILIFAIYILFLFIYILSYFFINFIILLHYLLHYYYYLLKTIIQCF